MVVALAGLGTTRSYAQQQTADLDYDTTVAAPAGRTRHPIIPFDEAHNNLHTVGGLYKPLVDLTTNDGYPVEANKKSFSEDVLKAHRLLVIANATGSLRIAADCC